MKKIFALFLLIIFLLFTKEAHAYTLNSENDKVYFEALWNIKSGNSLNLINKGKGFFVIVTDGDGTAQEQAIQLDVDKLAAVGDIGSITGQNHFIDRICQRLVAADLENALFHSFSFVFCIRGTTGYLPQGRVKTLPYRLFIMHQS